MLLQFNVSNFASFKDEVVLNVCANAQKEHNDILLKYGKERVLPSIAIFGANASGKTNIFKALASAVQFVRTSNAKQINDLNSNIEPFLFNHESCKQPSFFHFIYVMNDVKYEYGFQADTKKVYEEYLYAYKSQKPSLIFHRKQVNQYEFSSATKAELTKLSKMNHENKLFLATATAWNSKFTKDAFLWFSEKIDIYDSAILEENFISSLDYQKDPSLTEFMNDLLKNADIHIAGYEYKTKNRKDMVHKQFMGIFKLNDVDEEHDLQGYEIITEHCIFINGKKENFKLRLEQESNGTQKLFAYGPFIKEALEKGKTIAIDEIDNCLHPLLVQYLVGLFHNPEINKKGAQLLFNTHDMHLLDLNKLRRDQIYFVNKDEASGISELYSLDEFSPRKSEKVDKGYLLGRYGAIPNIK